MNLCPLSLRNILRNLQTMGTRAEVYFVINRTSLDACVLKCKIQEKNWTLHIGQLKCSNSYNKRAILFSFAQEQDSFL